MAHVFLDIKAGPEAFQLPDGLYRFLPDLHFRHPVNAVVGQAVVFVVAADQEIESVAYYHGVGVQDLGTGGGSGGGLQGEVRSQVAVNGGYFLLLFNGLVDQFNVAEQFRIPGLVPGKAAHLGQGAGPAQLLAAEGDQLADQLVPLGVGHIAAEEDSVNQPAQLRGGKLMVIVDVGVVGPLVLVPVLRFPFQVDGTNPAVQRVVQQVSQGAADRAPVYAQALHQVLLPHGMLAVRFLLQDLKQLEMDIFLLVVHVPFPLFFPKENTQVNRFALVKL